MKKWIALFLTVFALSGAVFALGVFAQDDGTNPTMTPFVMEGFSIAMPTDWEVDIQTAPLLANSSAAISSFQNSDPMAEGEIGIGILIPNPTVLSELGIEPTASAADMLTNVAGVFSGEVTPQAYEGLSRPAAAAQMENSQLFPGDTMLIGVETDGGVITFIVRTADFDTDMPLINGIIDSANYDPAGGEFGLSETMICCGNDIMISHPAGWTVELGSATPTLISSEEAATVLQGGTIPEGEIVLMLIPSMVMEEDFGILAFTPPGEAAESLIAALGGSVDPNTIAVLDGWEPLAVSAPLNDGTFPSGSHLISFEHPQGTFSALVIAQDFEAQLPMLNAMLLGTLRYTPDSMSLSALRASHQFASGTTFRYPESWTINPISDSAVEFQIGNANLVLYDTTDPRLEGFEYQDDMSDPYAPVYEDTLLSYLDRYFADRLNANGYSFSGSPTAERTVTATTADQAEGVTRIFLVPLTETTFALMEARAGTRDELFEIGAAISAIGRSFEAGM